MMKVNIYDEHGVPIAWIEAPEMSPGDILCPSGLIAFTLDGTQTLDLPVEEIAGPEGQPALKIVGKPRMSPSP